MEATIIKEFTIAKLCQLSEAEAAKILFFIHDLDVDMQSEEISTKGDNGNETIG